MPTAHPLAGSAAAFAWLLPLLPLAGFLANGWLALRDASAAAGADGRPAPHGRHPRWGLVSGIGTGVVAAAFALSVAVAVAVAGAPAGAGPFVQTYGAWIPAGDLRVTWAFQVDALSAVMLLVITGVGTLIHLFSTGYMAEDPAYPRYFAYLNLFVACMLVLVLGASYPVMFVGWEGVGLASYLLIGFWFSETRNADAGRKAFVVNRIGDLGFLVAMFLLWSHLGTLDLAEVARRAPTMVAGGAAVTAACLFLFLGAAGKSAQLPLYVWLPDAMAGPTPVSALIHAATMVTGGVYLVARSADLFGRAPAASLTVVAVGAATAAFSAVIGLKQWDIKKVLAYSTVSQLGMMFVAVGVGAYAAGVFHLVTHAFFKALLFLGAGAVIHALHHAYHAAHDAGRDAQDLRLMGGLARALPVTAAVMWVGTLALAGVPPFSGFVSKDGIFAAVAGRLDGSALAQASWLGVPGRAVLVAALALMLVTAFCTAAYMTRLMRYAFHGPSRVPGAAAAHVHEGPWVMRGPLVALAALAAVGGWLNLPTLLPWGPTEALAHWLAPVTGQGEALLAAGGSPLSHAREWQLVGLAVAVAVAGIAAAWVACRPERVPAPDAPPPASALVRLVADRFRVDELYDRAIVRPLMALARAGLWRGVDLGVFGALLVRGPAALSRGLAQAGARLQDGATGTYVWVMAVAVLALVGLMLFSR